MGRKGPSNPGTGADVRKRVLVVTDADEEAKSARVFVSRQAGYFYISSKAEANPSGAPFPLASLANIRPGPNVTKLFTSVIYECS